MENSIFHRLSSVLWTFIVSLIVLLAIYVSAGRLLTSNLSVFQDTILRELNSRVPFTIEAQQVAGEWHSFSPVVVLNELRLSLPGSDEPPLQLSAGRIGVDVLNSLRTGSLQLTRLALDGLSLRGQLTAQGKLRIDGFDGKGQIGDWFRDFLLNVELVALRDNQLLLTLPSGEARNLDVSLRLTRDGSLRRVEANLVSSRGTRIFALAEGVGNPFTPKLFTGELYLDVQSSDMGVLDDMLADGRPAVWADGALELELWLGWSRGQPSLEARVEARDLRIADQQQAWQVPLDRVSLSARVVERRNRWTVYASDLEVEKDGVLAALPRLQLDAWGEALRVRTADVPLRELSTIASSIEAMPAALSDVLRVLQPGGTLPALQFSVGDIAAPLNDWSVEANLDQLQVSSWKGAPGLEAVSGYLELDQGGGFVILDSQNMSMAFPTIYQEPLRYDDFYGTIHIDWDEVAMRLSSGLVTATGTEGPVQVLFGLNIPLVKNNIGLEMDLLVGLQKAHPTHRFKYVPLVLNEGLRQWLSESIGEGQVEEGAFLWRGTLKPGTAPLRTVQLAFNITDTSLDYHPRWPQVTVGDGIVLINDTSVSVWSDRARLFESQLGQLSAELWMNPASQLMLAVSGQVTGPADNGLAVVNDSPIGDIVGNAFTDWVLQGQLETDLGLLMNLTDNSFSPLVSVDTRWLDVDIDIQPGNLPLREINGRFSYNSLRGFSSANLEGQIWGEPLSAKVSQTGAAGDAAAGDVMVAISTRAEMADVKDWLNLESLAFAEGKTAVDVQLQIAPGEAPVLSVASKLAGVSLDVPSPWRKEAESERQLRLNMPLDAGGNLLTVNLDRELELRLHIVDGGLLGGTMAVGDVPADPEAGVLHVSGHAPMVHADEWTRFITRYFYTGSDSVEQEGELKEEPGQTPEEAQAESGELTIRIDALQADELVIWGQQVQDVLFSLDIQRGRWQLSAATDWLRGQYVRPADDSAPELKIDYLDLTGMPELSQDGDGGEGDADPLDLPDMEVTIDELVRTDQTLGRQLAFKLRSEDELLSAHNITGELAGMTMPAEHAGQLNWWQGQNGRTELKTRLEFTDLGTVLGYFGYEKILETEKGRFVFDLRWPGAPQDFSLDQGQGAMTVNLRRGSFLEAPSGASGALRVVSILNLADIVRRLSLSHMFESGIPFDKVDGEVFLHDGVIEVARMNVKGPSSFQFSGVSDIEQRSLKGELVATFPVANNLPWVAALTASLPIAAGVYLVSKVFQRQVNRLSSAVYSISGSWDDPQVEFDHIFDDTSEQPDSTTVEQARAGAAGSQGAGDNGAVTTVSIEPPDPQEVVLSKDPPDPQELLPQEAMGVSAPRDPQTVAQPSIP